jgi:hypothetical protein
MSSKLNRDWSTELRPVNRAVSSFSMIERLAELVLVFKPPKAEGEAWWCMSGLSTLDGIDSSPSLDGL